MRLAVTSDLHGHLPAVPACDVLVIAGDITPATDHRPGFQARWLDTAFRGWLDAAPAAQVVAIAGNHDFVFQERPDAVPGDLRWNYLLDASIVIDSVTFWGSPWTPWFWDWAFNAPKHDPDETFLDARYAGAPAEADVLVVHGPPAGYGDLTARGDRVGSAALLRHIDRIAPRLVTFGHIHEDRGTWTRGASTLINASAVDLDYALLSDPVTELEI